MSICFQSSMAIRSLLSGLVRNKTRFEDRSISTLIASRELREHGERRNSIDREILRLKSSKWKSAFSILQSWVDNGHTLTVYQLTRVATRLIKSNRHNRALEILTWIEGQEFLDFSPSDHARILELIITVRGLREAEVYFAHLTDSASQKTAALALLHGYVKERDTKKAESLMIKLNGLGLIVGPHPYNEMMKLYMATSQYEKVLLVILQMKKNKVPRTVLSYNLWMGACGEVSAVAKAEMVYKEMVKDENVKVGWSTISTLANIYIKAGLADKAKLALKNAESKLSNNDRLGYFFLITQYASLKDKAGVLRLWEASKVVGGRITCANYMCILSCLVKVGDLAEAERIFLEWESNCRKYDIRMSNILLGAYMRNGLFDKAESLHLCTLERAGCPNYKTWEILLEGWIKSKQMDKAINAMKKAFSMSKHCAWRPSDGTIMAIAGYFENHGNIEDAIHYMRIVRQLGLGSLSLYKLLLRMHFNARRPASDILKMMEEDKIVMDKETCAIVQSFS